MRSSKLTKLAATHWRDNDDDKDIHKYKDKDKFVRDAEKRGKMFVIKLQGGGGLRGLMLLPPSPSPLSVVDDPPLPLPYHSFAQ